MKQSGYTALLLAILAALLPLYVLSSGPAAALVENTSLSGEVLVIYWPLANVHRVSKPLGDAWWWHIKLWSDDPFIWTTMDRMTAA